MQTLRLFPDEIDKAADLLKRGEIVAFPTETVYGLGACVDKPEALAKIFHAKGRPLDNPLIIHIADLDQLPQIAVDFPESVSRLAKGFWPGPLTLVLKRHPGVSAIVSAGLSTIAVRMPSHPVARELIRAAGCPLAAPSANLSGRPSSTHAAHVLEDFDGKISAILDGGETALGIESTVLSLHNPSDPIILRPGEITKSQLEVVLGSPIRYKQKGDQEASPGMKYRHYAPNAPARLFTALDDLFQYLKKERRLKRVVLSREKTSIDVDHLPLSSRDVFASLRLADTHGYEEVLIYCDEETLQQEGLMNRLQKASTG